MLRQQDHLSILTVAYLNWDKERHNGKREIAP
jgi:hypothetical protein